LNENDDYGKGNRKKGMKKTHLMSFVFDPRTKDLADPIPEDDLDDIRDYTFEQILKYAEKQERNACIEAMRTNSVVNEENAPLCKKLRKSTTGSTRRDPTF
jgi:hypothetical protein